MHHSSKQQLFDLFPYIFFLKNIRIVWGPPFLDGQMIYRT